MSTKLAALHEGLAALGRRRRAFRWSVAATTAGLALLAALSAAYAVDWLSEMGRAWRLLLLAGLAAASAEAARRWLLPAWRGAESEADLALLVERQQLIDSDLVAAIQFESPAAAHWGSAQLRSAVIDYVADFSRDGDFSDNLPRQALVRRGGALLAAAALASIVIALAPAHFRAFCSRLLLLSRARYPTQTTIVALELGGRSIDLASDRPTIRLPWGQDLEIVAHCRGRLPETGLAELRTVGGALATAPLSRAAGSETDAAYAGGLPRLVDPVLINVRVGDDRTEPIAVELVELPAPELEIEATPPAYTGQSPAEAVRGARQLLVLEGSTVRVRVICRNKPLRSAQLTIDGQPGETWSLAREAREIDQEPNRAADEVWSLSGAVPQLALLQAPANLRLAVVDLDGLAPISPLFCALQTHADQNPRIAGSLVTRDVVPDAQPTIDFVASDDYGLSQLLARVQVVHPDGTADDRFPPQPLIEFRQPRLGREPLRGRHGLRLSPLHVQPGDQVRVTLEAVDHRGNLPGASSLSEPLVLRVTDEAGATASVLEADHQTLRQLDAVSERERQLGAQR